MKTQAVVSLSASLQLLRPTSSRWKITFFELTLCVALLAKSPPASALQAYVTLGANGDYSSYFADGAPVSSTYVAQTLADWNADGRVAQVQTGLFPSSSPFSTDRAEAFTSFTQASNYGIVRSKAAIDANYSTGTMAFSANVDIANRLRIENLSSSPANLILGQFSHGVIVSGGASNSVTASAEESLDITPVGSATPQFSFFGRATILNDRSPTDDFTTVEGFWLNHYTATSKAGSQYNTTAEGVEINAFYATPQFTIPANTILEYDIVFSGEYEVYSRVNSSSFYSLAESDFSNTGTFLYTATDPITGQPRNDVSFTIGEVVPEPGTATLLVFAICSAAFWRRRG